MPLSEDATFFIRVWIGQRCVACGAEFQYLRRFKVLRRDTMVNDTVEKIESDYAKYALETTELCPCPHCGWIQPDMIGNAKASYHSTATIGLVLALFITAIATSLGMIRPPDIGCFIMAGIAGAALLFHLYHAFANANRVLVLNLDIAKIRVEEGTARLVKAGGALVPPLIPVPIRNIALAAVMLLAAIFLFASPALLGWPLAAGVFPGLIMIVASGSVLGNLALRLKTHANPNQVVEVNSTVALDDSVPEDFRRK